MLGGSLIGAAHLAFFAAAPPAIAAALGGLIEVLFALAVFSRVSSPR
jgi:hypothetical protein